MTAVRPRLIAISDAITFGANETLAVFEACCAAARPGAVMVQLRDRGLEASELSDLGRALRRITRAHAQWFSVNDRLDLALALAADGVHLGEHSVGFDDARSLSKEWWISRACHAPEAVGCSADAWLLSPVIEPRKGTGALGLAGLAAARRRLAEAGADARLYALGGVDAAAVAGCLTAGADGVAAVGALYAGGAPALLRALNAAR